MKLFFPMGGRGKRFTEAGYTTPKPLLQLGGKTLLQWALESVQKLQPATYHFIPTAETLYALTGTDLWKQLPRGCWHALLTPTAGALQTLLYAKGCLMEADEELLICDCDSFLNPVELLQAIEVFRTSHAEGGVTVRKTDDPMCSFADVDAEWWVRQTREKDAFSPWSTTGPYWFRSSLTFLAAAQKAHAAQHTSISPVYNYLVGRTKAVPVSSFHHVGTPAAFEAAQVILTSLAPVSPDVAGIS